MNVALGIQAATVAPGEPALTPYAPEAWKSGSVSRSRLRRTGLIYLAMLVLGTLPLMLQSSASLQAAGIGLWFPGAGFLAAGGWWVLLLPIVIILFGLAFFAWFGSGMISAPIAIWLGSAALAAGVTGDVAWWLAPYLASGLATLAAFLLFRLSRKIRASDLALGVKRAEALPKAHAAMVARIGEEMPGDGAEIEVGELTIETLASIRYVLDRALQPTEEFGGFDIKDIFQTAALRYQINNLGYALAQYQAQYAPNFHGYLSTAQQKVIDKYQLPRVWNYWVYESMWGHFNFTDWDPAAKDNIMLTGYFAPQMSLYAETTGDQRYSNEGSLTFRLNDRKAWHHDVHSVTQSVVDNFRRSAYCLYPCEPNWIYPGCNFKGMNALAAHDRAYGTSFVEEIRGPFIRGLEEEFYTASRAIVPLRSSVTGIPLPFPAPDSTYAAGFNIWAPAHARQRWATSSYELFDQVKTIDGVQVLDIPNTGIDFGNYAKGALGGVAGLAHNTAREFGDEELAAICLNTVDLHCGRTFADGVLSYSKCSNLVNIMILLGRLTRRNSGRDLYNKKMPEAVRKGPILANDNYPDLLVARAVSSNGTDLDLVLYAAGTSNRQKLKIERLAHGRKYAVAQRPDLCFVADDTGRASIEVELKDRTHITIRPA